MWIMINAGYRNRIQVVIIVMLIVYLTIVSQ